MKLPPVTSEPLTASQIADLRLASSRIFMVREETKDLGPTLQVIHLYCLSSIEF